MSLSLPTYSGQVGILSEASGSSRFSFGGSTVLCAIHSPEKIRAKMEDEEGATIKVIWKSHIATTTYVQEQQYESILKDIIEGVFMYQIFPRSGMLFSFQVMEENGPILSTALNALCLALLDSGLPMKFLFAALESYMSHDDDKDNIFFENMNDKVRPSRQLCVFKEMPTDDASMCEPSLLMLQCNGKSSMTMIESHISFMHTHSNTLIQYFRQLLHSSNKSLY